MQKKHIQTGPGRRERIVTSGGIGFAGASARLPAGSPPGVQTDAGLLERGRASPRRCSADSQHLTATRKRELPVAFSSAGDVLCECGGNRSPAVARLPPGMTSCPQTGEGRRSTVTPQQTCQSAAALPWSRSRNNILLCESRTLTLMKASLCCRIRTPCDTPHHMTSHREESKESTDPLLSTNVPLAWRVGSNSLTRCG